MTSRLPRARRNRQRANTLTDAEKNAGWKLLFDGKPLKAGTTSARKL